MDLGNVIELSPLFLSLPTFFISLTFISVPDTYLSVGLQSFLLASFTLCLLSVLRFLGLVAPEAHSNSKGVRTRFRWVPLLVALVCVFAANNLLSPSRVMALLIIGALVSHSQKQFLLVFVLSLVWDIFACFELETKLVVHTLAGYLLLAVPFAWFLSPGSVVAYPSMFTAGVLSGASGLLLLHFCMSTLHINVLALSVGSLIVTVLSQLETTTTEEAHFDGFFNKTLFVKDYKVNLFIINTVTLLIYHISLNTKASSLDVAFTTLKSHLCESLIDYVLIFVIRPSQPSRRTSTVKADLDDGFMALLVQLFQSQETRSIFNFLLLNTSFMFVQLLYSFRSKSLSLLSDSLHMFLDCLSLFLGLLASLISKRSKDTFSGKYPFGLSRIETLAGFANGSLLVGIVFGIYNESVRRIFDPVDLQRTTELLLVSILGLLVNLVGIFAFNHGHDHSHSHSHASSHAHAHSHEHHHEHSHSHEQQEKEACQDTNNDNMHGIFLHILADTLGSVGVVVSTILIRITGYTVLDPLMSIVIATLIFASAVPLIKSSSSNLLLSLKGGDAQENKIRDMLAEIANTSGVKSYSTPRFWPVEDSSPALTGYIHIQYYKSENSILIRRKIEKITSDTKLFSKLYVQYENEMDDCWCRNVSGVPTSY